MVLGWIIDGRAQQDIWIGYPGRAGAERSIGTSVRFYDVKTDEWCVAWIAPAANSVITLKGGPVGDRIVLRGQDADGSQLRWSFNDMQANSFVWRGESSHDECKTWTLEEEHHMRRRTGA